MKVKLWYDEVIIVVEVITRLTVVVVVLDKKADMEVNQAIDLEVANIVNE